MSSSASATSPMSESAFDALLIQRFNSGDESAFDEIVIRYRDRIFSIAIGLLRNRADAEEITQDALVRAYRGLARFRGDSSLATWMHRITVNLARNRYWYFFRRRRQDSLPLEHAFGSEEGGSLADVIATEDPDPAQLAIRDEFAEHISAAMSRLDAPQREILTLRNLRALSYEEIADELGINVGTVKSRIARARDNLRALIAEAYPEFAESEKGSDLFLKSRPAPGSAVRSGP
jgi:RNA polymerase sigma-70 factor (ECF subfamily)